MRVERKKRAQASKERGRLAHSIHSSSSLSTINQLQSTSSLPLGALRIDFFNDTFRLSATLRFFEFRDLGRFVRRIFSIAWVFATAPAAGRLEFLTTTGLTQPGATALFRIYDITATGNERGSNTVTITRPPAG